MERGSKKWHTCEKCEKKLSSYHSLWCHKKNCHGRGLNQSPIVHPYNSYSEIPRQHHHADNSQIKDKLFGESKQQKEESTSLFKKLKTAESTNNTPLNFHSIGDKKSTPISSEDESSNLSIDNENSMLTGSDTSTESLMVDGDTSTDSDVSSAQDEEDKNIDQKVWRVIIHWGDNNNCCSDVLDAFKYFCKFTQALDQDSTIETIMDSVHTIRNGDDSIGFEEALNRALMKHKYLIYRTLE